MLRASQPSDEFALGFELLEARGVPGVKNWITFIINSAVSQSCLSRLTHPVVSLYIFVKHEARLMTLERCCEQVL